MIIFLHFLIFQFSHQILLIFFTPIIGFENTKCIVFAWNNRIIFPFRPSFFLSMCDLVVFCDRVSFVFDPFFILNFPIISILSDDYSHQLHKSELRKTFLFYASFKLQITFSVCFFYSVCFLYLNTCTFFTCYVNISPDHWTFIFSTIKPLSWFSRLRFQLFGFFLYLFCVEP